ncbi:MAG: YihY/virulence factor BrkB family protein [Methylococcales bacterium]|nr:YihY/virulence factor BrkB family protein [Methylococcales bacterium]
MMNHTQLPESPLVTLTQPLIAWSKTIKPLGFAGLALYDIGYFFIVENQKSAINTRASAVAFTFFLALFPAIIFFFSLIPFLPIDNLHQQLLKEMHTLLPENAYQAAEVTIKDLVNTQHNGLLSFGFLVTLYFATNGINALIDAFNHAIHIVETRNFIQQRLVSLWLFIALTVLILTASLLIIFSEVAINYAIAHGVLLSDWLVIALLTLGKWVISFLLLFTAISLLYYFGPVKAAGYQLINTGALLATILSIIASLLFNYYVNNFATYNKVYGSIGTIMVVMLWLQFNCLIILIGFDLNAKIYNRT